MLYDPKWEVEIKADPLSLEGVIAWLEKQPADEAYDYDDCSGACLYGLYMAHHGFTWEASGACGKHVSSPERSQFCDLVYCEVAAEEPWTFGAALERARAAVGK